MTVSASATEIRDLVAQAKALRPEIADGLTATLYAKRMSIEDVKATLFDKVTGRDPNKLDILACRARRPVSPDEAA